MEDSLRETIKANGWRQGSFLSRELCLQVLVEQGIEHNDDPIVAVVLTQDCDLLAPKLDTEPYVEVIVGKGPIKKNRPLDRSNRQIILSVIGLEESEEPRFLTFLDKERFRFSREKLSKYIPDANLRFQSFDELRKLLNMIVRRYLRPALSDCFNDRLKPVMDSGKKGYNLLKKNHNLFHSLHWSVPKVMEDLPVNEDYTIDALTGLLNSGVDMVQGREVLEELEELIQQNCQGINRGKHNNDSRIVVRVVSEISHQQFIELCDNSKEWDWEWLSR